eukprot:3747843-Prymnesium_polylepis.1
MLPSRAIREGLARRGGLPTGPPQNGRSVAAHFANGDLGSTRTATSARDRSTVAWAALGGPGAPCFRTVPSPKTSTRGR